MVSFYEKRVTCMELLQAVDFVKLVNNQIIIIGFYLVIPVCFVFAILWKKCSAYISFNGSPNSHSIGHWNALAICCCLSVAVCATFMSVWTLSQGDIIRQPVEFIVQAIAWYIACYYAYFSATERRKRKLQFPTLLTIWWFISVFFSCISLTNDVFLFKKHAIFQPRFWLDMVSIPVSSFLCFVSCFGRTAESARMEEDVTRPLLNRNAENITEAKETNNPYETAGFCSSLSFSWIHFLLAIGSKKPLQIQDIPPLRGSDSAEKICQTFTESIAAAGVLDPPTLAKATLLSVWKSVCLTLLLSIAYSSSSYVGPYLIDDFVEYLQGNGKGRYKGCILIGAFFAAQLIESFSQRQLNFKLQRIGIHFKVSFMSAIYRKGLVISNQARQRHTTGEIINYMSVDADRIGIFSWYLNDFWNVPLQVFLALLILYKKLGMGSFAAIATTFVLMIVNLPLGHLQERYHDGIMEAKDRRMKTTSEVLKNMRILKLQAWELKFLRKLTELRDDECRWLRKFLVLESLLTFTYWAAPAFVSIVTFGTCLLIGIPLTAGRVLSTLATIKILQGPIYNLPDLISTIAQTKVSLDRISVFLREEELAKDTIEQVPKDKTNIAIEINGGEFSWDNSTSGSNLRGITMQVDKGSKVAICGTIGSGKSSLLCSILGEMPKISGSVRLSGTKAYVSQSPWIQGVTIQENILFGKEMDRPRYDQIIQACDLGKDLELFSFGEQTVIGERGINLSGGQKQRIQLARAIYQDADIYLLDDPFSAVDAETGNHIFQESLLGLLKSKTVLYVTHQVEFLPVADHIIVMKGGEIVDYGRYNDILCSGTNFIELVGAHQKALDAIDINKNSASQSIETDTEGSEKSHNTRITIQEQDHYDTQQSNANELQEEERQLVQEEEKERGRVGWKVYWSYITAVYKGRLVPFMLLGQALFQVLQIAADYWMTWANPESVDGKSRVSSSLLIGIYVAFALTSSIFILIRSLLLSLASYKSANRFFNDMHKCIFHSPMSFFDSTPSGRILNRVSTDQSTVDLSLPFQLGTLAFSLIRLLAVIAVMSHFAWQIILVVLLVLGISVWYQQYQVITSRELARLTGIYKAPVLQYFSETIAGAITIRSFDKQKQFTDKNLYLLDTLSRLNFYSAAAMEWLCFRLDLLSIFTFTFALIFLVLIPSGLINAGVAGLAVTYGLNLTSLQAWIIWILCLVENKMISVERILQYTHIPSEAPLVIDSSRPNADWPLKGTVKLYDLQVRYAPHLPLVLKGLTCTLPGGMKIGIVGRTGSGKSTLIQAIFRMVEPSNGKIVIDDIDITTIGLHDLRSRLSIIPQDPTMFEGNLRTNIDPLEDHSDPEIWQALRKCQLEEVVSLKENKLDSLVSENGENWSVGQRQLVCLARAILKGTRILVLDEATASVDSVTDGLIQDTLRTQFSQCTVITVAHRIPTVIESDMALVLKDGQIWEYDTPKKLLEDKSSAFSNLVSEYSSRSSWAA